MQELIQLTKHYFDIQTPDSLSGGKTAFVEMLSKHIAHLLEKDFQQLLQIMYRIDIQEQEFALTLNGEKGNDVAKALAELVYERLMIKVELRNKYQ